MGTLSFVGMLLGIALFIFLSFKRFNLIFNAAVASIVVALTAGLPLMETTNEKYLGTAGAFLKAYLLLFILSALFGKVMEDSGAVRRIAVFLMHLTRKSKANQKFWAVISLPIFYFVLSYVGISGFVLVFTVVAIGRELFEECDIPWIYYCYGSAGILPAIILAGNLQTPNIIVGKLFGVLPTAAFLMSVILTIVAWIILALLIRMDIRKCEKLNEGFLPSGAVAKNLKLAEPIPEDQLPNIWVSALPLIIPVILIGIFKLGAVPALAIATLIAFLLFFSKLKDFKQTLSNGIIAASTPVVTVAMCSGLVTVIKSSPGFEVIGNAFNSLPSFLPPVATIFVMSALVGSSSSSLLAFGPYLVEKFAETGLSNEVAARLMTSSCCTYMMPHNPGVVNAVTLTKLDFKKAAWMYFKGTFFPGFASLIVAIILVSTGVFV